MTVIYRKLRCYNNIRKHVFSDNYLLATTAAAREDESSVSVIRNTIITNHNVVAVVLL